MKGIRHIFELAAVLFAVLCVCSCVDKGFEQAEPELVVSLYIPETVPMKATKADSDTENPMAGETVINTLQVWVFLHTNDENDGLLVSYKGFREGLSGTGLSNFAITRFGLPLMPQMYKKLLEDNIRVDVYAVANLAPDTTVVLHPVSGETALSSTTLGAGTTRAELERVVLTGDSFGARELTASLPHGIPMSGILRDARVIGSYPVLNISTLTLTRAVSKIRFVFCQQANPPTLSSTELVPFNDTCQIIRISFDGSDNGHTCEIADKEYLFTSQTHPVTQELFDIDGYTPLADSLVGQGGGPLLSNENLTCAEYPEEFIFRSPGHELESARQYETRLDASLSAQSQIGPIYLRETDKKISGTITYRTGNDGDKSVEFSLGDNDFLTRNHSWTVFAYFSEETKSLRLTVQVTPWDYSEHRIDYRDSSVNVIRRFTVLEHVPQTFTKVGTNKDLGFYDITFWHTVTIESNDEEAPPTVIHDNTIKGDIIIATPVGATICAIPVPGSLYGPMLSPYVHEEYSPVFEVTPLEATIYPNWQNPDNGRVEDCKITYQIRCNPAFADSAEIQSQLKGQYIDLHFCVRQGDRYIDLGSESRDFYRFVLDPDWNSSSNNSGGQ